MIAPEREFIEQVRAALARHTRQPWRESGLVCAAVLVPLAYKAGEWHVVVTRRTETVEHHKGQISFPGGACDPGDEGLLATALRETFEEIGVPPEQVEVLGVLDDFPTITGFVVTPFVGVIPHPFPYRTNAHEVAQVVEVPLSFLRDPAHLRVEQWDYQGQSYDVLFWDYGPHVIWGATARVLKGFLDLLG